ncbi:endonuclease domain-containing protein [Candidatus Gracilibacteria bacterium]|nr:endonuclease domain-containing protein [Candidatus Gracilibacteria bacterium]
MDDTIKYACRDRRRNMTSAETLFWNATRRNKTGLKIDRQRSVLLQAEDSSDTLSVIADFLYIEIRIIIEVNPKVQNKKDSYELDEVKDKILEGKGYKILRFTEQEVIEDIEKVIAKVQAGV